MRRTAILVVVVHIAIAVGYETRKAGSSSRGRFCIRKSFEARDGGDVVVIDARSARVDARVTTVVLVAAGKVGGADAGAFAAVTTVVTCCGL